MIFQVHTFKYFELRLMTMVMGESKDFINPGPGDGSTSIVAEGRFIIEYPDGRKQVRIPGSIGHDDLNEGRNKLSCLHGPGHWVCVNVTGLIGKEAVPVREAFVLKANEAKIIPANEQPAVLVLAHGSALVNDNPWRWVMGAYIRSGKECSIVSATDSIWLLLKKKSEQ